MQTKILMRVWLGLMALLAVTYVLARPQHVPPRRGSLQIEIVLMAGECEFENQRLAQTLLAGLRCVRGKIDERVEELEK